MKVRVSEKGLLIPKEFLDGIEEAEVRKQNGLIVVVPLGGDDPIFRIGKNPVESDVDDGAENHDRYLYGR